MPPLHLPSCSKGLPVTLELAVPTKVPSSTDELRHMEAAHQVGASVWLACRAATVASGHRVTQVAHRCEVAASGLPDSLHACTCPLPTCVQVVMLWLWLSYRFDPEAFPMQDKVGGSERLGSWWRWAGGRVGGWAGASQVVVGWECSHR
jgi:hypothetical protein